ncbi:hypothetical protein SADUNF_Sadunf15G0054900 [Salix dunnii]|uniref:Uncharacterized protein n=1 Tax=Salix dunnii TaxID=1413687 RepID=A0A835JC69_9ROSI|nr:hypothetical protein SADUNF_Sadunf15G0054900 [Salix dunnii]
MHLFLQLHSIAVSASQQSPEPLLSFDLLSAISEEPLVLPFLSLLFLKCFKTLSLYSIHIFHPSNGSGSLPNFVSFSFLSIPTVVNGDVAQYATDMYQNKPSGTTQKLIFSKFDAIKLDTFFKPGTFVDSYLSLDPYDYQQSSGIRLVASKLIIHNE